jgi:hypothetical protein
MGSVETYRLPMGVRVDDRDQWQRQQVPWTGGMEQEVDRIRTRESRASVLALDLPSPRDLPAKSQASVRRLHSRKNRKTK